MKQLNIYILTLLVMILSSGLTAQSIYDYSVVDIEGNNYSLEQLKGKKVMIVNVASKCGLTPQYEQLQAVYEKYKDRNFMIIGFPANNFMKQEPGTDKEIKEFCSVNYGVTFPMMSKISVKGDDIAPVYEWLTNKDLNGYENSTVKWNFQKYLINENGELVDVVKPMTKPDNEAIIEWITGE